MKKAILFLVLSYFYGNLAASLPNTPQRFSCDFHEEVVLGMGSFTGDLTGLSSDSSGFTGDTSSGFPSGDSSGFPSGDSSGFPSGDSSGFPSGDSSGFTGGFGKREENAKEVIQKIATKIGLPEKEVKDQLKRFKRNDLNFDITLFVKGSQEIDFSNNIWKQHAKQIGFTFPFSEPMTMDIDATMLMFYDLNKNFTWDGSGCTCEEIEGSSQMPLFTIPPFATATQTGVTITINGQQVITNVFDANFKMGFFSPYSDDDESKRSIDDLFNLKFEIYVDSNNHVRRMSYSISFFGMSINTTFDMWNIRVLTASQLILPDDSCKDKCVVVLPTEETYPQSCTTTADQCTCPPVTPTFCSQVNYPISTLISVQAVDQTTQEAYNAALATMQVVGDVSQECRDGLKDFLCKFYFPVCNSTYNMLKPDLGIFTCGSTEKRQLGQSTPEKQREKAMESSPAFSAYLTAEGKTVNQRQNNEESNGNIRLWNLALIVITCLVALCYA